MNASNPYAVPKSTAHAPKPTRLRDQQLLRQFLLYCIFYFVGLACMIGARAGIGAVYHTFSEYVLEDFIDVWLWELMLVAVPYAVMRASTIGRIVRPRWWSFCVAGLATYPFLTVYMNLLVREWDTPWSYNLAAHLLSAVSAILTELLVLALPSQLPWRVRRNAEQDTEPESPTTGF